jgi:hypothetical protein
LGANAVGIDCWWELFLVWSDYCFTNNFLYLNYLKCQKQVIGYWCEDIFRDTNPHSRSRGIILSAIFYYHTL